MDYVPEEGVNWIYEVMTFVVDKVFHETQSVFFENRQDFSRYAFDDINKVLDFCKERFGVEMSDFKKDWETNYPQW